MLEVQADPAITGGVYANRLAIWHTAYEFTLDFMVPSEPAQPVVTNEGRQVVRTPHRLVTRVRVPPSTVFEILRALNENMTHYEGRFGAIKTPGQEPPLYPPPWMGDTGNDPTG
jgi:Protein of unknown function (DUF3467)